MMMPHSGRDQTVLRFSRRNQYKRQEDDRLKDWSSPCRTRTGAEATGKGTLQIFGLIAASLV